MNHSQDEKEEDIELKPMTEAEWRDVKENREEKEPFKYPEQIFKEKWEEVEDKWYDEKDPNYRVFKMEVKEAKEKKKKDPNYDVLLDSSFTKNEMEAHIFDGLMNKTGASNDFYGEQFDEF